MRILFTSRRMRCAVHVKLLQQSNVPGVCPRNAVSCISHVLLQDWWKSVCVDTLIIVLRLREK